MLNTSTTRVVWTTILVSSSFLCNETCAFVPTVVSPVLKSTPWDGQRLPMPPPCRPRRRYTAKTTNLHSSIWTHTFDTVKTFSSSSTLQTLTDRALQTPPIAYFCALLAAGVGVPVSEDALCLFAGTVWGTMDRTKRLQLLVSLYGGVVLSDIMTFWIGRALRMGMLEPIRKRLQLTASSCDMNPSNTTEMSIVSVEGLEKGGSIRKRDKIRNAMNSSGDYIGFVIRFSVGTRGPLMLVTGFANQVKFWKFLLGTCVGASLTVPLQLYVGYTLGHKNPAAIVTVVGGISTFVLVVAAAVGIASWGTLFVKQLRKQMA